MYGFDIPVTAVDTDFDLAILGTKGKWYDHVVSVRDAVEKAAEAETPADGTYTCDVTLEGGSGRATVESPAALTVADGKMTATIVWSSPNYDYMIVDGEKYLPTNTEGNSTFEIPVSALDTALDVTADTVAMSTPHEIEYTLTFDSASLKANDCECPPLTLWAYSAENQFFISRLSRPAGRSKRLFTRGVGTTNVRIFE